MTIPNNIMLVKPSSNKQPSNLWMYIPETIRERGKPCSTPILQLIYQYQPSVFLNLGMIFLYKLIATTIDSKGTFTSTNLFHKLILGFVSKSYLKTTKQQKGLDLLLWHSSAMILSVTRWSVVEWFLLKLAWPLSHLPYISIHSLIFFSKIISYSLAKRGLIIIVW